MEQNRTKTLDGYQELQRMVSFSFPMAYEKMEGAFLNHALRDTNDLIRLIAFAWSWMPRIPKLRLEHLDDGVGGWCILWLQELSQGNDDHLKVLLETLVPMIDNSVIGVSKMLYFAAPEYAPILDNRVVKGWNKFFDLKGRKDRPLRLAFKKKEESNIPQNIDTYLRYRSEILHWKNQLEGKATIRDIEKQLFLLGGK